MHLTTHKRMDGEKTVYCEVMECEVKVEKGECDLKVGSILGQSSCPNKSSLICPLTKEGNAVKGKQNEKFNNRRTGL